jgi:hypothetical protein
VTSSKPSELSEAVDPKGHFNPFNPFKAEMWYYNQPAMGVHPEINENRTTCGEVWAQFLRIFHRSTTSGNILAHPAGNLFSLRMADIHLHNQVRSKLPGTICKNCWLMENNELRKFWEVPAVYNTQMATRKGDATILLAYLRFIIRHHSQLPSHLLFIEVSALRSIIGNTY